MAITEVRGLVGKVDVREATGGKFVTFGVCERGTSYINAKGEKVTKLDTWYNCIIDYQYYLTVKWFLKSGTLLDVEGFFNIEDYTDKQGVKKKDFRLKVTDIQMLHMTTFESILKGFERYTNKESADVLRNKFAAILEKDNKQRETEIAESKAARKVKTVNELPKNTAASPTKPENIVSADDFKVYEDIVDEDGVITKAIRDDQGNLVDAETGEILTKSAIKEEIGF